MRKITKTGILLEFVLAVLFLAVGVSLRLLPHPPNFSPITAIALFGGVYFYRKTAFLLPIAALVISDIFLGFYDLKLIAIVYLSFILCVLLGQLLKKHKNLYTILGVSFLGSFTFFILTNFAVWAFYNWYPKTLSGLINCYVMGLPFFKNSLLGDFFFVAVFFGAYELAGLLIRKKFVAKNISLAIINNH